MNRQLIVFLLLFVTSCTWGRSKPDNCVRFRTGSGLARLEQLAAANGLARVQVEHNLCSNEFQLLQGLPHLRRDEVGWCARIEEPLPANAPAVAASVGRWCDHAVEREVRYAHWSSILGDELLFVSEFRTIEQPLHPQPQPPKKGLKSDFEGIREGSNGCSRYPRYPQACSQIFRFCDSEEACMVLK